MAEMHFEFNSEERSFLVIANRHTFSLKLKQLRDISALEEGGGEDNDDPGHAQRVIFFRGRLEDGMQAACRETLDMIEEHLLPFSSDAENTALYNKMKADAYWILAMLKKEEDKEPLVDKALAAYKAASKAAEMLSPAHPLKLAVNLTEAAFYFDVMQWTEVATDLTKLALDKARPKLASLDEESYKKSTEIMELMKYNLKLWNPTSPKSQDYSESSTENNIPFSLTSLSLEAGPCYSNDSPSPPLPSPSVVLPSAALLEARPSYSNGGSPSPPPVVPLSAGPLVASNEFIYHGDWGYEFHEGLSQREIRFRKKAAQIKKGRMG